MVCIVTFYLTLNICLCITFNICIVLVLWPHLYCSLLSVTQRIKRLWLSVSTTLFFFRLYASESGIVHQFDNATDNAHPVSFKSLPRPFNKIIKTLCWGQWPRPTGENGQIKDVFLFEKSVIPWMTLYRCCINIYIATGLVSMHGSRSLHSFRILLSTLSWTTCPSDGPITLRYMELIKSCLLKWLKLIKGTTRAFFPIPLQVIIIIRNNKLFVV